MSQSTIDQAASLAEAPATPSYAVPSSIRLLPLDALRGLIMIVMALDHANFFIAGAAVFLMSVVRGVQTAPGAGIGVAAGLGSMTSTVILTVRKNSILKYGGIL
jgi:hypothetical protein